MRKYAAKPTVGDLRTRDLFHLPALCAGFHRRVGGAAEPEEQRPHEKRGKTARNNGAGKAGHALEVPENDVVRVRNQDG